MHYDILIVGGGHGGAQAAIALRQAKYEGSIGIVNAEPEYPYERPPLSKDYFAGDKAFERIMIRPAAFWAERAIDIMLGQRVDSVDPAARQVTVFDGTIISYGSMIWATGGSPRQLPVEGGNLSGMHVVRTRADVDRMLDGLDDVAEVAIVGGGYIGLEAAAVAAKSGLKVTLIEMADRILQRVAAPITSDFFRDLHKGHGVDIREGIGLMALTGEGHVRGADLSDGSHLDVDLVIVGIGITPNTQLAEAAGLRIENGIWTDSHGRTSDAHIWAAGDCASLVYHGQRIRLESVGNAIDQAEVVAQNMMGGDVAYQPRPWFWSDQYDCKLQIGGLNMGYDAVHLRKAAGESQSHWYYKGDELIAVDAMNDPRDYMVGKRLIEAGKSPSPEVIRDPATDMKALLRS